MEHPQYRALPVQEVGRIGAAIFLPDADEEIAQRFPQQWLAADDRAGDRAILAAVLDPARAPAPLGVAQAAATAA